MSKKESLTYEVQVEPNKEYKITARIGDANSGDHNVFGTCPYETEPENDNPEWISKLVVGNQIKNTLLFVTSATQKTNPQTKYVSSRIFINDEQILPKEGIFVVMAEADEIVYFNQKINFI